MKYPIGVSHVATLAGLGLVFSILLLVAEILAAGFTDNRGLGTGVFGGLFIAGYLIRGFSKAIPSPDIIVPEDSADTQQARLLKVVGSVCDRAGVRMPQLVMRDDARANLCSYGPGFGLACMYVNKGLLSALRDDRELEAAVAHEVHHIKNGDTLFFSGLGPLLWGSCRFFALLVLAGGYGRRCMRGRRLQLPPLGMFMPRGGDPIMRLLVLFSMAMLAVGVLAVVVGAAAYAGIVIGATMAVTSLCYAYARHVEFKADEAAADLVGDSDLVLIALARSLDSVPEELDTMNRLMAGHSRNPGEYALSDVVQCIKANGSLGDAGGPFLERMLRRHPPATERIARLVQKGDSEIG